MRYVIIGGDAAGMSAAMQIKKYDEAAEVITLERGHIYSYGQCGLPYVVGGLIADTRDVIARSVETFRDRGIDAKLGHEVQTIDTAARQVRGVDHERDEAFIYDYDKLLIATGGDPVLPNWEGRELAGVHVLKTIPDTDEIIAAVTSEVQVVTIIGGGYIGLEMAENFYRQGKQVRVLQRGQQVAKMFDADMAAYVHEEAERVGIELILGEDVQRLVGESSIEAVETDHNVYHTDLLLAATGIRPNTSFLQNTNITLGVKEAVMVDEYMRTSVTDVYAAGDCAVDAHRVKKVHDYIPLGTTANKQGRIAGMNMTGVV